MFSFIASETRAGEGDMLDVYSLKFPNLWDTKYITKIELLSLAIQHNINDKTLLWKLDNHVILKNVIIMLEI